jgi:hypothetical protein
MLNKLRVKLANIIAPDYIQGLSVIREKEIQQKVNQRIADTLGKMDILDILLKDFHGTFSKVYERPEDKLDAKSRLGMVMWGYTQSKDPHFEYITSWIEDTYANETIRHAAVTPERILYGRALIAMVELLKREVNRLSNIYEEMLENNKVQDFDPNITIE